MHYNNKSSIAAVQLMPVCDELKHGSFLHIGGETWNWIAYVDEYLFMTCLGNTKIFDEIHGGWK